MSKQEKEGGNKEGIESMRERWKERGVVQEMLCARESKHEVVRKDVL